MLFSVDLEINQSFKFIKYKCWFVRIGRSNHWPGETKKDSEEIISPFYREQIKLKRN